MTKGNALRFWSSLLLAAAIPACSQRTENLSMQDLDRWLQAYGSAWESKDAAAVAMIFTERAFYQETPFAEPFRGREEISDYWSSVTADQDAIEFEFSAIATSGNKGIAQWSARFRSISGEVPVELDGVFVLEFADSDHVSGLREWWHVR